MGAAQVGGLATLIDIDFDNAAGFMGEEASLSEALFIVYFLSHSLLFCTGALIEPHVVLTTAECVFSEKHRFEVNGGAHKFLEGAGTKRSVTNVCLHKGYNTTGRWTSKEGCTSHNLALLVLNEHFSTRKQQHGSEYIINRIRYGIGPTPPYNDTCQMYGWGSRRNGYLIPLLINLYRWDLKILPKKYCDPIWNYDDRYLCVQQPSCESETYGALCPDDIGSVIVCSGYVRGIMVSRLVDRPCGVGFLDLTAYNKFLTCGVDETSDVLDDDLLSGYEHITMRPVTPAVVHVVSGESREVSTPDETTLLEIQTETLKHEEIETTHLDTETTTSGNSERKKRKRIL